MRPRRDCISNKFPRDTDNAGWGHTLTTTAQTCLVRMHTPAPHARFRIFRIEVLKSAFEEAPRQEYKNHNLRSTMTLWLVDFTITGQCIRCYMSISKNGNNAKWLTSRLTEYKEHSLSINPSWYWLALWQRKSYVNSLSPSFLIYHMGITPNLWGLTLMYTEYLSTVLGIQQASNKN